MTVDDGACAPDLPAVEQDSRFASVRRDRPVLYATRHLIKPTVLLLVAIAGIGTLLRTVMPRIDVNVEWLESWGREHLSWVPDPLGWAAGWLGDRLGGIQVADWLGTVLRNAKWWLPILFAAAVGIAEICRRWAAASALDDPSTADDNHVAGADGVRDAQTSDDHGRREGSL